MPPGLRLVVVTGYDVIIVGGGPAGLSAALMLGRCRRRVLVCDSGQYRNAASNGVHGFLSRDGIHPAELLDISRQQLVPYGVEYCQVTVKGVHGSMPKFRVEFETGGPAEARRLLIATGVVDKLPPLPGTDRFYGTSIHHCPYCDAWEHRDQKLAVYGQGRHAVGLALSLKTWSNDVVVCTSGPSKMSPKDRDQLQRFSIPLYTAPVTRLEGSGGALERVVFKNGESIECNAIFFNTGQDQHCSLGRDLTCAFTHRGVIKTDKFEKTSIPGVYAVGDCSRNVQFVAVAAAQGAIAAQAINIELQEEDRAAISA
jgi:thioredoxin reductase